MKFKDVIKKVSWAKPTHKQQVQDEPKTAQNLIHCNWHHIFNSAKKDMRENVFFVFFPVTKLTSNEYGFYVFCCFFFSFGSKLIGKNIILENLFSLEKLHRLKKYLLPTKTLMKTNTVFCSMVTQKPVISFCSTLKIIVKLENQSSTWMNLYLHLNITEI